MMLLIYRRGWRWVPIGTLLFVQRLLRQTFIIRTISNVLNALFSCPVNISTLTSFRSSTVTTTMIVHIFLILGFRPDLTIEINGFWSFVYLRSYSGCSTRYWKVSHEWWMFRFIVACSTFWIALITRCYELLCGGMRFHGCIMLFWLVHQHMEVMPTWTATLVTYGWSIGD